jgi:hypothetical protein
VYHAKEANIAKALIGAMGIEQAEDAAALLHWRRPQGHQVREGKYNSEVYSLQCSSDPLLEIFPASPMKLLLNAQQ